MAFILLAVFYLVIDVWDIWSGAPLFYPGIDVDVFSNNIKVYMDLHLNLYVTLNLNFKYNSSISTLIQVKQVLTNSIFFYCILYENIIEATLGHTCCFKRGSQSSISEFYYITK